MGIPEAQPHMAGIARMERGSKERIEVNPNVHFGRPCVAGTTTPVQDVLALVAEGIPFLEIVRDYHPDIQVEGIRACVRYAAEVMEAEDLHVTVACD